MFDCKKTNSFNFVLRLAFRYFSAKKNNKFVSFISMFSLLGVMLGVAALIVVMAVMEGFHIELTSNIIGLGGDITISSAKSDKIYNFETTVENLRKTKFIKAVVPEVHGKALAISGSESSGILVRGINSVDLSPKKQILDNQLVGNITDIDNGFTIAIGKELAINLDLDVGDDLAIICPGTVSTMLGNLPRKKTFKIVSIFSSGMYEYDSGTVIMSLGSAQKLFDYKDAINLVELYTDNPHDAKTYAKTIRKEIGKDFYVRTWFDNNAQFLGALKVERVAMFTILSLIIVVAAFNIISSLFMLVNEKRKDVAILKTMGASYWQILSIFILNGSFIGLIGTSLGVLLGIGFATNIEFVRKCLEKISGANLFDAAIYFLYHLPSKVVPESVITVAGMTMVISILATIYPASRAASIDPAEALRNE